MGFRLKFRKMIVRESQLSLTIRFPKGCTAIGNYFGHSLIPYRTLIHSQRHVLHYVYSIGYSSSIVNVNSLFEEVVGAGR